MGEREATKYAREFYRQEKLKIKLRKKGQKKCKNEIEIAGGGKMKFHPVNNAAPIFRVKRARLPRRGFTAHRFESIRIIASRTPPATDCAADSKLSLLYLPARFYFWGSCVCVCVSVRACVCIRTSSFGELGNIWTFYFSSHPRGQGDER